MNSDNKRVFDLNDFPEASPPAGGGGWVGANINCDLGEGIGNDELIMPYIDSANIACGYHAGDVETIKSTITLCIQHKVHIGAHPSFYDRKNFGRTEMNLLPGDLYDLITQQLYIFKELTDLLDQKIDHVKPHGALYNMSARDASIAKVIARAVKDFDNHLILFGLSGSHSISEAKAIGLKTASEVFADRTYQDDGSLTPRSQPNAVIEDAGKAAQQVLQMIKEGSVTTVSGRVTPIVADTICIHGDGKNAVEFAKLIHDAIKK
ncbi:MAG TPA: 5-oxoprolinase subunit PxpA [Chitinophagaceae bacterium]|nr:5-oxoprolinase subunit PxpA [Chitinophagaceae bacterium]